MHVYVIEQSSLTLFKIPRSSYWSPRTYGTFSVPRKNSFAITFLLNFPSFLIRPTSGSLSWKIHTLPEFHSFSNRCKLIYLPPTIFVSRTPVLLLPGSTPTSTSVPGIVFDDVWYSPLNMKFIWLTVDFLKFEMSLSYCLHTPKKTNKQRFFLMRLLVHVLSDVPRFFLSFFDHSDKNHKSFLYIHRIRTPLYLNLSPTWVLF